MNYASIRECDIANGEGVRVTLFVSGCTRHCKGCFNPDQWSFDYGEPFDDEVERRILDLLVPFLRRVRGRFGDAKTVWVYTGCLLETELQAESRWRTEVTDEFLSLVDVLVDGPFVEAQKDISLRFRGSANQRIIELRKPNKTKQGEQGK